MNCLNGMLDMMNLWTLLMNKKNGVLIKLIDRHMNVYR